MRAKCLMVDITAPAHNVVGVGWNGGPQVTDFSLGKISDILGGKISDLWFFHGYDLWS